MNLTKPPRDALVLLLGLLLLAPPPLAGKKKPRPEPTAAKSAEDLLIVDCLLPGQLRRLGRNNTFLTPRRPVKTTAADCAIRGGEYVAYDRSSYATALEVWLPAAQAGDAEAQNYVGEIFEKGLAATPDYEAAATWYRKAADQGSSRGQINLANLYEKGQGVPQDAEQALAWYRRAAGLSEAVVIDVGREAAELRQEIAQATAEASRLGSELTTAQQELETARRELERAQAELEELRRKLQEASDASAQAELEQRQAEIDSRRARLAARESNVESQAAAARSLEEALASYTSQLAQIERTAAAREGVAVPGPTIAIVRPDVLAARGTSLIPVPPGVSAMEIVGSVEAPAGLGELKADDRALQTDPRGFFRVTVATSEPKTVTLVATDLRGQSTRTELQFGAAGSPGAAATASPPSSRPPRRPPPSASAPGKRHALLISASSYSQLPRLETAAADAAEVAAVLRERYGFTTTEVSDPTYYELLAAFEALRETLTPDTELLVYYAGHGKIDPKTEKGYWIPVDADADNPRKWIPNEVVSDYLDTLPARHVLVVSDSCYAGTLTRSGVSRMSPGLSAEERSARLQAIAGKQSRTVLTSGGLQPVLDEGGGGHSIFARAFLTVLRLNSDPLPGLDLHRAVAARVTYTAAALGVEQVPDYAPIQHAGHEAGDFVLVPKESRG